MKKLQTPLFLNIDEKEWNDMNQCGCMRQQHFPKNTVIFHMGDFIREIGIVLSGTVNIENIDLWGNKSLLSSISPGQLFAESYVLCQEPIMVNAITAEPSEILFLNLELITNTPFSSKTWYAKIMKNMLQISLHKNLTLANRIFCTTPKTIRGRLFIYLSEEASKTGSTTFQIPLNRQELADYLNLDRSALSKELGKMRDEGILEFHKNQFTLFSTSI